MLLPPNPISGRPQKRGHMAPHSSSAALRVLPATEPPASPIAHSGPPPVAAPPGVHGLNTLRAVSDYGPSEMMELDSEIAGYLEKVDKLQLQRNYLSRLLSVAQEYYELKER